MRRLDSRAMAERALSTVRNAGVPQPYLVITCAVVHHLPCAGLVSTVLNSSLSAFLLCPIGSVLCHAGYLYMLLTMLLMLAASSSQ